MRQLESVKTGLDRLEDDPDLLELEGKDLGLISNQTGLSKNFTSTAAVLRHSRGKLRYIFGPEHGFAGGIREGASVENGTDLSTGIPIIGLYDKGFDPPKRSIIADLDTIIYDIQDIGARCYTYIYTMINMMDKAARSGTEFVILDRPAPTSGLNFDGSTIDGELKSFIGGYGLPMVYGLTPGELSKYVNSEYGVGDEPEVLEVEGWSRDLWFDETDLPWVAPSPGIPQFMTTLVYPATVLLEATNVSEGRGTTKPFQYFGAPWIVPDELIEELSKLKEVGPLKGFDLRACSFTPRFAKYPGERCYGCQIYVRDRQAFSPFLFGLSLLKALKELYPDEFSWYNDDLDRDGSYFDRLAGSTKFREWIDAGEDFTSLTKGSRIGLNKYRRTVENYFLYA